YNQRRVDMSGSLDAGGTIEWEITASPDWKTLYRGKRELQAGDIEVIPQIAPQFRRDPKPPWWTLGGVSYRIFDVYYKQVLLEGGFLLELHSRPTIERHELESLVLVARRTTVSAHSFEF